MKWDPIVGTSNSKDVHGRWIQLSLRSGFWKQSKWPWNTIHLIPCKNPCTLYIHLAFTYSIGPSSVVWSSELGPSPPSPPMRVLELYWSWALSLMCEVVLRSWIRVVSGSKRQRVASNQINPAHLIFEAVKYDSAAFWSFNLSLVQGRPVWSLNAEPEVHHKPKDSTN